MDWSRLRFVLLRRMAVPRSRWLRSPFSSVGVGFGRSPYAVLSFVHVVGSRLVLLSSFAIGVRVFSFRFPPRCSAPRVDLDQSELGQKVRSPIRENAVFK